MTSYKRISGRTLNREVSNNGNIDVYMNPIGRGIYPSFDPNTPVNGVITGNLSVSGDSTLTGTLDVGGNTVINGNFTGSKAVSISANSLTSGSALDITSTSAGKTSGGLVNIVQTGATTTQTAPSLIVSTTATTNSGAGVASFTGDGLTTGNAVSISATAVTTGSALKITAVANKMGINVNTGVSRFNGGIISQSTAVTTSGGKTITAAELINGYTYVAAAGSVGALLTLPGAAAVQTALTAMGITSAAGTRLPPLFVQVTDATNTLIVTAASGGSETIYGTTAITNVKPVIIQYIFTGAATAAVIIQ